MRSALLVFCGMCTGGCGAFDAARAVDASVDASLTVVCAPLRDAWRARVAMLDDSCNVPEDCVVIGGAWCGPRYLANDCSGESVKASAVTAAAPELRALDDQYYRCLGPTCSSPCVADCPTLPPDCVDHVCVVKSVWGCLSGGPRQPDAGPSPY